MTAKRVRVEGDLFHGRVPEGAVYVGRAAPGLKHSRYANPFRVGHRALDPQTGHEVIVTDREVAAGLYGLLLAARECTDPVWVDQACADLGGRDLACWCPPGPCHVDPLLVFVNGGAA